MYDSSGRDLAIRGRRRDTVRSAGSMNRRGALVMSSIELKQRKCREPTSDHFGGCFDAKSLEHFLKDEPGQHQVGLPQQADETFHCRMIIARLAAQRKGPHRGIHQDSQRFRRSAL